MKKVLHCALREHQLYTSTYTARVEPSGFHLQGPSFNENLRCNRRELRMSESEFHEEGKSNSPQPCLRLGPATRNGHIDLLRLAILGSMLFL